MPVPRVVVIGGSAGAIEPLVKIVAGLPKEFEAAVCVAVHYPSDTKSTLPEILRKAGSLPAFHAANRERLATGRIYVAPPGFHLTFDDGETRIIDGPRENWHRPSIDVLFRSAAQNYGGSAIAVVVSGMLDDGAAGMAAIASCGGIGIAQSPEEAAFADMPRNAIGSGGVTFVLRADEIAAQLERLVCEPLAADALADSKATLETTGTGAMDALRERPSPFTCPECGGTLFDVEDTHAPHYRCRVGHAFGPHALLASQSDTLEGALWAALRSLEEQGDLARRVAARSRAGTMGRITERLDARVERLAHCSSVIRNALHEVARSDDGEPQNGSELEIAEGV